MQYYLWRAIGVLLLMSLVGCGGLDRSPIPEPDKPTTPQPEGAVITLLPSEISFSDEGGAGLVSVKIEGGDGVWNATTDPADTWVKLQIVNPSASDGQLRITAQLNNNKASRVAIIAITSNKQAARIAVSQNAAGSFLITKNSYDVLETGATIDVEVKHDVEFQTEIPEAFNTWITSATTKQLAVTVRSFVVKPNADAASREGYINIISKLGTERVNIRQFAASAPEKPDNIVATPSTLTIASAGGQAKVAVAASAVFTASVTQGAEWLRVMSTTATELQLEATVNTVQQKREAVVKLNCGAVSTLIVLTQESATAYDADITITTPGTLQIAPDQLSKIHALKLSGPLNALDFELVEHIANLENLDLSGVTGTALPANAYTVARKIVTLVLPTTLEKMPMKALAKSQKLKKITLGIALQTIGNGACGYCEELREVIFVAGSRLHELSTGAFMGCAKLEKINLPQGVESVGVSAFSACVVLKEMVLPPSVRQVGMSAFASCEALENITIPEGVKELGATAFANCSGLRVVRLPASIVRLRSGAFGGCRGLGEVMCGAVEPPVLEGGKGVFVNVGNGCTLRVPMGAGAKYQTAEGWKEVFAGKIVEQDN